MSDDAYDPGDDAEDDDAKDERFAVLDVFGLKLEVSNPRLAELLTQDAVEGLKTNVGDLRTETVKEIRMETAQAAPDVVIAPPTPKDEHDAEHRREVRARVASVGERLGFETTPDGVWHSPTSLSILTRAVDRSVSLAAATHFIDEIAPRREQLAGVDSSVLFVVETQQSSDVFKVGIRQRHVYDVMRVVTIDDLEDIGNRHATGQIDHSKALVLLTPIANIDVGEVLSVMRATDET